MFKQIFLPLILVATFITLVGLLSQGKFNSFLGKIPVTNDIGNSKTIIVGDKEIKVEVAKTNEERAKGLSNREKLEEGSGMLFVFEKNSKPVFWMKDTKIALDIIWINDEKIVGIEKNVQPEPGKKDNELKKYNAPTPVDYVLEVSGGYSEKNNIKTGSTVQKLSDL